MKISHLTVNKNKVYQEPNSFFRYDGEIYYLNMVFQITKNIPAMLFPVNELSWILFGSDLSPERVEKADLSYPIIISELGDKFIVIDGAHRLAKAIAEKDNEIQVKIIFPEQFKCFALPHYHKVYNYNIKHEDLKDLQTNITFLK
jgi:hypothetical protein